MFYADPRCRRHVRLDGGCCRWPARLSTSRRVQRRIRLRDVRTALRSVRLIRLLRPAGDRLLLLLLLLLDR